MTDEEALRMQLHVAGAELPEELLAFVTPMVRPLLDSLDDLLTLDFGSVAPFVPAHRLIDDARR